MNSTQLFHNRIILLYSYIYTKQLYYHKGDDLRFHGWRLGPQRAPWDVPIIRSHWMGTGYSTKSTFLGAYYVVDWKNTGGMGGDLEEETGVGGPK